MIDLDEKIRDAIAEERDDAPLPIPWHEVLERNDRREAHRGRRVMLAAAAVVVVGALGLVAALVVRDRGGDQSDEPSTEVPGVDPLDALAADDWVVPDPVPDGFERVHAELRGGGSNAKTQEFANSDGAVILVRTLGRQVEMGGHEPVDIDGVQWRRYELTELSGRASVGIARNAGSGWVSIHSIGDPALLEEFAQALATVPDTEIDFEVLDSDRYVDIATVMTEFGGPTTFRVREGDAHYCAEIEAGDGSTSRTAGSPTGCHLTTAPDVPVQPMLSHASEGGTVAVGIAEPDVASIEFRFDEIITVVEPTDEPREFEHRFWIAVESAETNLWAPDAVTVEYDDGTRVDLERSEFDTWKFPAVRDASADATADDPLADLTADDWVVPDPIPDGYERVHAEAGRGNVKRQLFASDAEMVWINTHSDYLDLGEREPVDVDGIEWRRNDLGSVDEIERAMIRRTAGTGGVTIESIGGDSTVLELFAAALVTVPDVEIDFEVLDPNGRFTAVTTLADDEGDQEAVLQVRGLNRYYCDEIEFGGARSSSGCSHTASVDRPIAEMSTLSTSGRSFSSFVVAPEVDLIELRHGDDLTIVEPTDESGQFEHRFLLFELGGRETNFQTADGVTVVLHDGTRVELERSESGTWRIPRP